VYGHIVDFYCCEAKLVVELDGGQHAATVLEDVQRTRFPGGTRDKGCAGLGQ
jgi:very-short-patch-repair endonuclease